MANEDSFINEVSEEVRRDRFYKMLRRYGWIALAAVIVLVGGTTWNEWRKANARTAAEALGNSILASLDSESAADRADALTAIEAEGDAAAVVAMLAAAESDAGEDAAAAVTQLEAIADNGAIDPLYRELAALKAVSLSEGLAPSDRIARLEPLTVPGAPYRPLALEMIALAHVETGGTDEALSILQEILADGESPQGLRQRASQLIVALGGSLSPT